MPLLALLKSRQGLDMNELDLAYTAGIIDGEGCIGLYLTKAGTQKPSYQIRVSVHNTNEWLVQWLETTYGGYTYNLSYENRNWKHQWQWIIASKKALTFLKQIYPYLRLKKPQAEIAIKFQEMRQGSGVHLTKEERFLAESQRVEMAKLNKRGR